MLCPVHPACTASLRQRWHSNIGDMATSPKLSSMFCQGLLSSLPSTPSSSQTTLLSPVPRSAGAEVLCAPGHSSKPGGSRGGEHSRDTRDPSEQCWQTSLLQQLDSGQALPLLDLPGQGADDQSPCLTMQLQIQQSCALQVPYRPFGKAALNLHRVTSCTGGLYSFTGYWS